MRRNVSPLHRLRLVGGLMHTHPFCLLYHLILRRRLRATTDRRVARVVRRAARLRRRNSFGGSPYDIVRSRAVQRTASVIIDAR
jgi:hypothetical protein